MVKSNMKLLSFDTLQRGDWLVRVSVLGMENILVCLHNEQTFETIIRSYTDELDANLYIEYIIHKHLLKDEFDE
jgi:hypothetical protein